ncbi:MAG: NAD(P)H-dependent oxidoreductase [Reichenbachiella sp.]
MKTLIIYSHPSKQSYTSEVLEQLKSSFENEKLAYEISDLYAMNFQSDMSEEEYDREGFANLGLPLPDDVMEEHRKIEEADCIIFIYPVWWSDCPAKLKGWFDRVYSVGYAYGYDESGDQIQTMKTIPYGVVICTAGHPNKFLDEIGIAESMRNVMLEDRLGKRFSNKEMIILGGTLNKEEVREKHSQIIDEIGSRIRKNVPNI